MLTIEAHLGRLTEALAFDPLIDTREVIVDNELKVG